MKLYVSVVGKLSKNDYDVSSLSKDELEVFVQVRLVDARVE